MRLVFDYTLTNKEYKPIIPLTLSYKSTLPKFFRCLIDSGADRNILPREVAELLGVKWKLHDRGIFKKEKIHSFTGTSMTIKVPIRVLIREGAEKIEKEAIFNVPIDRDVKFPVLIGRPLLNEFVITLDGKNKVFTLETHKD